MSFHTFSCDESLRDSIKEFSGNSQATIELVTKPKCTVKSRLTKEPYEEIFKHGAIVCASRRYVTIGNTYEVAVNNRRAKEGKEKDFEADSLPWGEWVPGSKILIQHNGNTYLRVYYLSANSKKSTKDYYFENGEHLPEELIPRLEAEFLPVEKENEKQGLEKEDQVIVNTVKLSGIVRLHFAGILFVREGFESDEEIRLNLEKLLMISKVAGNPAFTLKEIYERMEARTARQKSKIRYILSDRPYDGLYRAC